MLEKMDREADEIRNETLKMCWYMRGLSFSEGMHLSHEERDIIGEIIKENLETTKKSGLPFF
jgi:hypothetical protein